MDNLLEIIILRFLLISANAMLVVVVGEGGTASTSLGACDWRLQVLGYFRH